MRYFSFMHSVLVGFGLGFLGRLTRVQELGSIEPARRGRSITALMLVGVSLLAGCGGSSHKAASANTTAQGSVTQTPTPPGPPPAPPPPVVRTMAGRVLVAGDLPGFAPPPPQGLEGGTNARSWMASSGLPASEQAKEAHKLEALGFVRGARERLAPTGGGQSEALSIVMQFRSPRAALANVSGEVRGEEAHGAKSFAVPRIPGAHGFGGVTGANTGYNVTFADGAYYYLVGAGYPTGSSGAPTRQDLITAAQHLYARVHH